MAPHVLDRTIAIDRHGKYGERFFQRASSIDQTTLRSPYEHHLGTHRERECELLDFARFNWEFLTPRERGQVRMAQSGQRSVVPMDIFEAHTEHVIRVHNLESILRRGEVEKVSREGEHYVVQGPGFVVTAGAVVVCSGERRNDEHSLAEHPTIPWDEVDSVDMDENMAVSGSGLSAAYLLRKLLRTRQHVFWLQGGDTRFQCSDVDAKFFRPEGRALFRNASIEEKRMLLGLHRRSSIMFEFSPILRSAMADGKISAVDSEPGLPEQLSVITAHGTKPELPAASLQLQEPMIDGRLPLDNDFRVKECTPGRMFAIGTHGVFAGGPAARNIDGIRYAAEVVSEQISREALHDAPIL